PPGAARGHRPVPPLPAHPGSAVGTAQGRARRADRPRRPDDPRRHQRPHAVGRSGVPRRVPGRAAAAIHVVLARTGALVHGRREVGAGRPPRGAAEGGAPRPARALCRHAGTHGAELAVRPRAARGAAGRCPPQPRPAASPPAGRHPRAVEMARSWRSQGLGDEEIVDRALRMFNEQEFYYTLQPPLAVDDAIDQFLFETRQGFCEHYAAAFTVLMRAAGIPARVVTGYQGGTLNPVGGYVIVRQRDAHAWAEVWLGEKGWVRVDPTAAVAPNRILGGIETALPDTV